MLYGDIQASLENNLLGPTLATLIQQAIAQCATLPEGRYELFNGHFCLVQAYHTKSTADMRFEKHARYADVQIVLEGSEIIYVAPAQTLQGWQPFDTEKDIGFCPGDGIATPLVLSPMQFAYLAPQDAHKPCCHASSEAQPVRKLVIKVLL